MKGLGGAMDRDKAQKMCVCRMCPTYFDCGEPIAFCVAESGKSKCITIESGCVCPGCPVQTAMRFEHDYYCIHGPEKEQSLKK
jgi:hypothetical protein